MFGGLTVLATIVLARRVVAWPLALAAGLVAAVTPLVVFHAQLLKEDIFLAPWLLLGLAALDRLRENAQTRRALAFGLLVGLATSAKYIGVVLVPLACVVPLIAPVTDVRRYYASLAWSGGTAVGFSRSSRAGVTDAGDFLHGLNTEIVHSEPHHRLAQLVRISCFTGR
jgi:4-amino-4-deoxy-L-arabinose transferase-like glycosyltransferase